MKKPLLIILLLAFSGIAKAQKTDSVAKIDTTKWIPVDVEPQFPGGIFKFMEYVQRNEKTQGNNGKVWVSFVVEKDGSLSDITVTKSLSESADKEAVRLLTKSPKWLPGMAESKPCRVRFKLPIIFQTE